MQQMPLLQLSDAHNVSPFTGSAGSNASMAAMATTALQLWQLHSPIGLHA
jgi:hypothetical protein